MRCIDPIIFEPIFMDRVWGGRRLETLFGKHLPSHGRIGESWELVDREEAQSVVHNEPFRGKTLHELWTDFHAPVFGNGLPSSPRFPLLFKLLDARERLSVQVHPPAHVAPSLGGEPKTEMWYIIDNDGDGDIFAGLRSGVGRAEFEKALATGSVEQMIHRIAVRAGECIFIPSGRVHAIGAGNVIVEVQQSSDTTYRVFDWNRVGLDGKARELHIGESLQSIDFADIEPRMEEPDGETLVRCPYFQVDEWRLHAPRAAGRVGDFAIFTVLNGAVRSGAMEMQAGEFFLLPASMEDRVLHPVGDAVRILRTVIPAS